MCRFAIIVWSFIVATMIRFLTSLALASVFVLTAAAQQNSISPELARRIERQVRTYTEAPPDARVTIGARSPSKFPGYDNLPVTIESGTVKKPVNFLIAADGSKLLYMTEIDLREDP